MLLSIALTNFFVNYTKKINRLPSANKQQPVDYVYASCSAQQKLVAMRSAAASVSSEPLKLVR